MPRHVFTLDESPLDDASQVLDPLTGTGLPPLSTLAVSSGRDILVELDAYDIVGATTTTFYFGTKGYNHPTAPDYYTPRLIQPINFRRDIYAAATTGGSSRVSYGEIRLANGDGGLDFLRNYGLPGQRVRVLIGDAGDPDRGNPGQPYSEFELLLIGKVQQPLFGNTDLVIQLRDRQQDFAQAVQQNKYGGTNVLPDGVDGTDDIKDKPIPLTFGYVNNVSPPCVNTAKQIYQVNDGPAGTIEWLTVYHAGETVAEGADYTDLADMLANDPSAGQMRMLSAAAGSYFRLGFTPTGAITCDVADRIAAADNTAGRVALRIASRTPAIGDGGIGPSDYSTTDLSALDTANGAQMGVWVANGETYQSQLDLVFGSIGAWAGFDRTGLYRMQRLELPVAPYEAMFRQANPQAPAPATRVLAVGEFNIIAWRFLPTNDPEKGMPTWQVTVDHTVNFTVQPASAVAGAVTQDRRNFLELATRSEMRHSEAVRTIYPFAVEKTVSTVLLSPDDAGAEAFRLVGIYDTPRDFVEIDVALTLELIALIDVGSVVAVDIPRFAYGGGKLMRVIGMQYSPGGVDRVAMATLVCWG